MGPLLASVPGLMMAATQGPLPMLYAALIYAGVHFIGSNLITPLVQAEVVHLRPVLTIFAALIFGLLLGPIGVFLAAPLTVVLMVIVSCDAQRVIESIEVLVRIHNDQEKDIYEYGAAD